MTGPRHSDLVLAIHPFTRGLAFALFESPLSPVDWGIKEVRGGNRNTRCLAAATALLDRTKPDIVIIEDSSGLYARRSRRIRRLQSLIANAVTGAGLDLRHYPRECIRDCFKGTGAVTRHEIAEAIAAQIPALADRLPPVRRVWESEDPRMALFDAASLVLTHCCVSASGLADRD